MKQETNKGITIIALVITIIVLLILVAISIATLTGENGILNKSQKAKEENNRETATEIIKLKITSAQMDTQEKEQRMPTLKELSLAFKEDEEIEYVTESSEVAAVKYEVNSDNPSKIYTKLKQYPYEFEINKKIELANVKTAQDTNKDNNNTDENYLSIIENGEYDVSDIAKVKVNVPTNIVSGTKEIEETGEYDVSDIASVIVKNLYTQAQYNEYGDSQYNRALTENMKKIPNFIIKAGNHHYDMGFKPSFIFYVSSEGAAWAFDGDTTLYYGMKRSECIWS